MKIAFLAFDFGEYSIRLASALAQQAEICLLLPQDLAAPYLCVLDRKVDLRLFHKPRLRQPRQQLQMIRYLLHQLRDFAPDVIHLQQGHGWFNLALPFLPTAPLVCTIHDPFPHLGDAGAAKTPQWIYRLGFRHADALIVHNEPMQALVMQTLGLPATHIQIVPHLTLGEPTPADQVQEAGNQILFFGRIWEYKGLSYLIHAEPLITKQVPDARIVIAGEGEDFTRYRKMMHHPEHFIVHNEFIADERIPNFFQQASIVVLPYIEATQSGIIPLAYRFSKPVVATTVGGLPAAVVHEETGLLIPPGDEHKLADAIVRLLQNEPLRRRLGENGRYKAETEFSAQTVAQQTLAVYRQLVRGEP